MKIASLRFILTLCLIQLSGFIFAQTGIVSENGTTIIEQAGTYLGISVANIINLLNPQIVIIGGGVSQGGESLLKYVRAEAKKRALKELYKCTKIVRAKLADRAGVIGAAGIAIQDNP